MKKKLLFISIAILSVTFIYRHNSQETPIEKLRKQHTAFLKNHPYNTTLALSKSERKAKGIPPNKYFEQEYLNEINPTTGRTHPENVISVQRTLEKNRLLNRVPGDGSDNAWVERGPNNVGGRTKMVLFDPNDANHKRVFAGGVSGGLWVNDDITDENSAWERVGITENLSVTCMTVDPNNSQIMYVGTGESYTGDDGLGNGLWKSTDGGTRWTNIFSDNGTTDLNNKVAYINDVIAWNNPSTNTTEVFMAVGSGYYGEGGQSLGTSVRGLYKSTDGGANWNLISGTDTNPPIDLELGADNKIWYGSTNGKVVKSTDGATFSVAYSFSGGARTEIATSKTNADKIYVLINQSSDPVIYKTTNGFTNVTATALPNDADSGIPDNDFTRGQQWYSIMIGVDPSNDEILYVGGIDLFRSTDAGTSWTQISKWSNNNALNNLDVPYVHADHHGMAFHPTDSNKGLFATDGGVFYAVSLSAAGVQTDPNNSIVERTKDYSTAQFYKGAIGQDENNETLLAGAQDNGTHFVEGANAGANTTTDVYGGDGTYCFIDKEGEYMIVSYVYNNYTRLDLPYTGIGSGIDDDDATGDFINIAELDDNLDILYTNGKGKNSNSRTAINVYKNIKTASPAKTLLSSSILTNDITALKISPYTTTSSKLFVGLSNGNILKVTSANSEPSYSNITGNLSVAGSISDIQFGANEDEIMVTFHNYGVDSIWFTENGGTTWANKEGDFPDIPIKAILMNPLKNEEVIIGTELGVWKTSNFNDASPSWTQSNNGMSNVKVTSFDYRTSDNTVFASTYGRGMFTGKFTAATASVDEVVTGTKAFTIYPTISNGNFTLFGKNTLGNSQVTIFDINGRQVYQKNIDFTMAERNNVSVNLSSGIYMVNLVDAQRKKTTSKIIIE